MKNKLVLGLVMCLSMVIMTSNLQAQCSITNVSITNQACDASGYVTADVCFDFANPLSTMVDITFNGSSIGNYPYPAASGGCVSITTMTVGDGSAVNVTVEDVGSSSAIYISEIHYDNDGSDLSEFIEVTAPVGTDLTGYTLELYNSGTNGTVYSTITLSGIVDDEGGACGALDFSAAGIQNGGSDGIALVDPAGTVLEFISYEGTLTATGGAATGMTSADIGVAETSGSPATGSVSLISGTWTLIDPSTPGDVNAGAACAGPCENIGSFTTPNCCMPITADAYAFCSDDNFDFVEGSYYIEITNVAGGVNSGTYNITSGAFSGSVSALSPVLVLGPFVHSGVGNAIQNVSITETTGSCTGTLEVLETYCTDIDVFADGEVDNNKGVCDCNKEVGGVIPPGVIIAQAEPGTFVSGGTSGQTQYYLLANGNSGNVQVYAWNQTGFFGAVPAGTFYVYAVNVKDAQAANVIPALSTPGLTVNITDLEAQNAPFDSDCYMVCGPAEYVIDCGVSEIFLACNDHINVTVNASCQVTLDPDVFLEGENLPDGRYSIEITDADGDVVDYEQLTASTSDDILNYLGEDLTFTVTENCSQNSCWGTVTFEDKSIPELDCDTVTVLCTELNNLAPGSMIKGWDRAFATQTVGAGSNGIISMTIDDVEGTVENVILNFHASVEEVSDLGLSLTSPNGQTTIDLIDQSALVEKCSNSNINVCLSDDGEQPHSMFGSPQLCRWTLNAFIGSFRPLNAFSGFDGDDAQGNWVLTVKNGGSTAIQVLEADLQIVTNEGTLLVDSQVFTDAGCLVMPNVDFKDGEVGENCLHSLWTTIEREWTVTNPQSGNSGSCTQIIQVRRFDITDIVWPKNFDDLEQETIPCGSNVDTGSPELPCGGDISEACNFAISGPVVLDFPICGDSYKRINTWTVLDWCTGALTEYRQVVKVEDNEPLIVSCVPDQLTQNDADALGYDMTTQSYQATLDPGECTGRWTIVPPIVSDLVCNSNTTLDVYYKFDDDTNPNDAPTNIDYELWTGGNVITGLPVDRRTWIRMVVTDDCGNTGECFTELDVLDDRAPYCIAKQFVVVGLSDPGTGPDGVYGKAKAESFDNGSFDCTAVTFQVRRIFSPCNPIDMIFGDDVKFCCDDLGQDGTGTVEVELRVTDAHGNSCVVKSTVHLFNKVPLTTTCPDGFVVDCTEDYNRIDAYPTASGLCGDERLTFIDQSIFNSTAPATKPANQAPLYYIDGDNIPDAVPAFDERCQFGALKRTITDNNGLVNCVQYIVVEVDDPFNANDIVWPSDVTTDCSNMTVTQPRISSSECVNTGVTMESDTFFRVEGYCLKVINHWTVINWCEYDQSNGARGVYTHDQLIVIDDKSAPTVSAANNLNFEITQNNCAANDVVLSASALDIQECFDDELNWTIEIDYDSNGSVEDIRTEVSYTSDTILVALSNVRASKSGHSVTWTVTDDCENSASATSRFTVEDKKAPTPYCLNVTTTRMDNGQAELWAIDLNGGSFDNCSNQNTLRYTFTDQAPPSTFGYYNPTTGASATLADYQAGNADLWDPSDRTSGHVFTQTGVVAVTVYVWDECDNYDFCIVNVDIQDNSVDNGAVPIAGSITTEMGESVQSVMTELMDMTSYQPSYNMTNELGEYAFEDIDMYNNYKLTNTKNDDYLNGVSTLDLLLIQRHILGQKLLDSPYKMIAADVNNDNIITAVDLIELRKLILGIYDELPDNGSWEFVDAEQQLSIVDPWIYRDHINLLDLAESYLDEDFIGVKIGDVNNTVTPNVVSQSTQIRENRFLNLSFEDRFVEKGELVDVEFSASDEELFGYQFSLKTVGAEIIDFSGRDIFENNFNYNKNLVTVSHNSDYAIHPGPGFITLSIKAKKSAWLSDLISISSEHFKSEAYVGDNLNIVNVRLYKSEEDMFRLYQNEPNPFSETTRIRFELPKAGSFRLTLHDVSGKLIDVIPGVGKEGYNSVVLTKDQIGESGLIYYTLKSSNFKATRHMILIK